MQCFADGKLQSLHKGAVSYADAVVTTCDEAHRCVEEHISSKPVMRHTDEPIGEQYVSFYERVISQSL